MSYDKKQQLAEDLNAAKQVLSSHREASKYGLAGSLIIGAGMISGLVTQSLIGWSICIVLILIGSTIQLKGNLLMRCPKCRAYIGDPFDSESGQNRCHKCYVLLVE